VRARNRDPELREVLPLRGCGADGGGPCSAHGLDDTVLREVREDASL
jgi:hypothetical protein